MDVSGICLGELQRNGSACLSGREGGGGKEIRVSPPFVRHHVTSLHIMSEYLPNQHATLFFIF